MPTRSTIAAANGAPAPYSSSEMEMPPPTRPGDQPNSSSYGFRKTPGVARKPAAISITRNVTASTTHA